MGRRRQGAGPVGSSSDINGSDIDGSDIDGSDIDRRGDVRRGERQAGRSGVVLTSIQGGATPAPGPGRAQVPAERAAPGSSAAEIGQRARIWHVVLNVAGRVTPLPQLKQGLEQLAHEHPPFLTARYAADHAEIRYWEQADDLQDAAAMALRLWGEHRVSAALPPWEVVGLEVVDRPTYHKRIAEGYGEPPAFLGGVHPY